MKKSKVKGHIEDGKDNFWSKISLFFFNNVRTAAVVWATLLIAGVLSFTTLLKREGFPPIAFPLTVASGTYFVDDPALVDKDLTQPLSAELATLEGVDEVQGSSGDNFFSLVVFFDEDVDAAQGTKSVMEIFENSTEFPEQASVDFLQIDPAAFLAEFDMLLSVYGQEGRTAQELEASASAIVDTFVANENIVSAEIQSVFDTGVNPLTGDEVTLKTGFHQVAIPDEETGEVQPFRSVTIGVNGADDIDIIELSEVANEIVASVNDEGLEGGDTVYIAAEFAEDIKTQISSLQGNLFTGLIAVAFVSLLLITWRASIVTALFMVTVVLTTLLVLFLVGYTLNTITLFALILSLGLFVDDATIIVEAIDANNKKGVKKEEVIRRAIKKVAAASFAGTTTTVLVFAPLLFVTGILGEFIRLMPVTVIISLVTSLLLSLTLIPFISRFVLLDKKVDSSWNPITKVEKYISSKLAAWPLLLKTNKAKGVMLSAFFILLSFGFIMGGGYFASKLSINIFPPSKDSNQILVDTNFAPGTSIEEAEAIAFDVSQVIIDTAGEDLRRIAYGPENTANERSAGARVELVPFTDRERKSPEIMELLEKNLANTFDESSAEFRVLQLDSGPPVEEFPFKVQIFAPTIEVAEQFQGELAEFLEGRKVERANGTSSEIVEVDIADQTVITRSNARLQVELGAAFDDDDTTSLVTAAQDAVEAEFTEAVGDPDSEDDILTVKGYEGTTLEFDFGQESDNAESFESLGVVYPIALLAMFILLAIQFRSFMQPLLIFLAIPFSFFGVTSGLFATDNAFSFFVQIGFIGLIGIAVNNTILLTDYANQERRAGKDVIDSISAAAGRRFRPLVTTSLTTVVALLPLALADPFWEALAFTIIFGLLSSTFLVVVSFPYYYLAAEGLKSGSSKLVHKVFRRV